MDESQILLLLRAVIAEVLGFEGIDDIDVDMAFVDLGITSLVGVEIADELERRTGIPVAVTAAFDYPTCRELARSLADRLAGAEQDGSRDVQSSPPDAPPATRTVTDDDPVVIVGMSCRYPGGVQSAADLWQLVAAGTDAVSPLPTDRGWDGALFDPDPDRVGHTYVDAGGFLDDPFGFDAEFFGISPREAVAMDPQQRLLLEEAWAALEDAGIDPTTLQGSPTATYFGVATHEYFGMHAASVPAEAEGWFGIGNAGSVVSGRVAYALGLEGPALTIDTACSSSLSALHLAVSALERDECSMALVGGCTLMPSPIMFVEFSRQRALSPDGRCRSFAEAADGTGWAEGVGVLVVERLSDARRRGHRVRAVVRSTALNQDGASNGLSAPNGRAQQRVILEALHRGGLGVDDVDLVEAHGTGTSLGDPIEATALLATYGRRAPGAAPLFLGSLKSNIGHSQAAAGVGAIIKAVMALEHELMPATLHADQPSSHVDWSSGAVELLTVARPWPQRGRPRRAGVSAFGISGTNAHVIVEEAPPAPSCSGPGDAPRRVRPVLLSARSDDALQALADRWLQAIDASATTGGDPAGDVDVAAIADAARRRTQFRRRAGIVTDDPSELIGALDALRRGDDHGALLTGRSAIRRTAFVFPGQGAQWTGMLRELHRTDAEFGQIVGEVAAAVDVHTGWSTVDALHGRIDGIDIEDVDVVQPLLFVSMVSLARFWAAWGVRPDVVIGHSQGELAAACVSGAIPIEEAARILVTRARLIRSIEGRGAMGWLALPEREVAMHLEAAGVEVWIAGVNGPRSTVIAGDPAAVDGVLADRERAGAWTRRLPVTYASHTPHIDALRDQLIDQIGSVATHPSSTPMWSTVLERLVQPAELTAEYWFENLRRPVRFDATLRRLLDDGVNAFVEVSPHPILATSIESIVDDHGNADVAVLTTLERDQADIDRFVAAVTEAHVVGVPATFDWPDVVSTVALPTYPFQHRRLVLTPTPTHRQDGHVLLGQRHEVAGTEAVLFTNTLSATARPWLSDHAVLDHTVVSGTTIVEALLAAGSSVDAPAIDEVTLEAPIVLHDGSSTSLQTRLSPNDDGTWAAEVHARAAADEPWLRHATGTLTAEPVPSVKPPSGGAAPEPIDVDALYDSLTVSGLVYGPSFRALRTAERAGDLITGTVAIDADLAGEHLVHPALLDACFHAAARLVVPDGALDEVLLPFEWRGVTVQQPGLTELRFQLAATGPRSFTMTATDARGVPAVSVAEVTARPISPDMLRSLGSTPRDLYVMQWEPLRSTGGPAAGRALHVEGSLHDVDTLIDAELADLADTRPAAVVVRLTRTGDVAADRLGDALVHVVDAIGVWLAHPATLDIVLVFVTDRAVAVADGAAIEPVGAAVWGLIRSAQSEHPDRFLLLDGDGRDDELAGAVSQLIDAGEPQGAIGPAGLVVPRLARVTDEPSVPAIRTDGTVVVTGGTTGIGLELAKHLAARHGVRRFLLLSRRGEQTPNWAEAAAPLLSLGAVVEARSVDVSDGDALAAALASVPASAPIRGIIHSAGVLRDALVDALDRDTLHAVIAPKVPAAVVIERVAHGLDLDLLVFCSSLAGVVGGPGQANYAAANAYIDALASRHPVATSIPWGLWDMPSTLVDAVDGGSLERLRASGLAPMSIEDGLRLFDAALGVASPVVVAAAFDHRRLREAALAGTLPRVLDGLVRVGGSDRSAVRTLDLSGVADGDLDAVVLDVVASHAAAALGYTGPASIDVDLAFKDLGFDSLAGVQLRNRLSGAFGRKLSSTLVFDYPTPRKLAAHLASEVRPDTGDLDASSRFDVVLDELGRLLVDADAEQRRGVRIAVSELLGREQQGAETDAIADRITNADADDLLRLIDESLL